MLNMEFKSYWYKHMTVDACYLCSHVLPMAGIPTAAFVFDDDLVTELETYAKAYVELLLTVANGALASSNTFSESGLLHW